MGYLRIPLLLSLIAMNGCSGLGRWVDFRVHRLLGAEVISVDDSGFRIVIRVEAENPNGLDASLTNIRYSAWMGTHLVGRGRMDGKVKVKARQRFVIDVPVRVVYADLPADLPKLAARGRVTLRIACQLQAHTSLGSYDLELESTDQVAVDRALHVVVKGPFRGKAVRVEQITLDRPGLLQTDLVVRLRVRNAFAFPIHVRRARFSIAINGVHFGEGMLNKPLRLAPRSTGRVVVTVAAQSTALGPSVLALLSGDPSFRVTGSLLIKPLAGVSKIPLDIEADASVLGP